VARRTYPDRRAQLALPLGEVRAQVVSDARSDRVLTMRTHTLVVEPSSHHVEAALRAGAESVTTLPLLEAALARALLPDTRVAARALSRIVLRPLLAEAPALVVAAERAGLRSTELLDAVDTALGVLHAAHVEGDFLSRATRHAPPGLAARASMLSELMSAHDRALAVFGLIDPRTLAGRLSRALARCTDLAILAPALGGAGSVELRDVTGLSPARLGWIEALHALLARAGGRVSIVSPTAHASLLVACGIDDPRERLAARLEERFAALSFAPELVHHEPGGPGEGPLTALVARAFTAVDRAPIEAGDSLRVVAAAGAGVQAEVAAAEVALALRRGHAPERVVIALPELDEPVLRPLRRALREHGVPFYEGRGAPPFESLPISNLLRALRAIDDGPHKDLVLELLRGVPSVGSSDVRLRAARALERAAGSSLHRDGDALLALLEEPDVHALVSRLFALLTAPSQPTLRLALAHVRSLAEALGFPDALARHGSEVVLSGDDELLSAYAADLAAWSALAAGVDELGRAMELAGASEQTLSWMEFSRELEVALEGRHLVPGHRAGAVPIARLRDRLGLDCDVLVVLETHDGALPSRGGHDPLVSRALIRALREADPRRAPPPASLLGALDLLSALDAIGRTRARAVVTFRSSDDDGRRQLPGALPIELLRVSTAKLSPERMQLIPTPAGVARGPRALVLHAAAHRGEAAPEVQARAEAERARARAFAAAERGELGIGPFTGDAGPLDPAAKDRLVTRLGATRGAPLAVSAAEKLLACPFLVFAERVLNATPDEPVEDDGGARELGELAHRALLVTYRALRDGAILPHDSEAVRETAQIVIGNVLAEAKASSPLQRVRRERLADDLLSLVLADVENAVADRRRFFEGEVPFGRGEGWPALPIGGGAVFVAGQIDRIDRLDGGSAMVIDYKSRTPSGSTTAGFFDQHQAGSVQIALYARVVAAMLEPPPGSVIGRFFGYRDGSCTTNVGVRSGKDNVWRDQVGDAALGEGEGAVASALVGAVAAARAGAVPPRRGLRCNGCAQRAACRVPPVVLEEPVRE